MTTKTTITEKNTLSKALITFRKEVGSVKKGSANPFYKSKYADLPTILEAIKDPLEKSGMALYHLSFEREGAFFVKTILSAGDETAESVFPVFGTKPQEIGSSMTYARRYNIQALLDIPTEDDDGNKANAASKTIRESIKLSESDSNKLENLILEAGLSEAQKESTLKITNRVNFESVCEKLREKAAKDFENETLVADAESVKKTFSISNPQ